MSANQIPAPFRLKLDSWSTGTRDHDCTRCWANGGPGHTNTDRRRLARHSDSVTPIAPAGLPRKMCGYWSARAQQHCGNTHQVRQEPAAGPRCSDHWNSVMEPLVAAALSAATLSAAA